MAREFPPVGAAGTLVLMWKGRGEYRSVLRAGRLDLVFEELTKDALGNDRWTELEDYRPALADLVFGHPLAKLPEGTRLR